MATDVVEAAVAVKSGLEEGSQEALSRLLTFADEFAVSRSLSHQAVLRGRDLARAEDDEQRAATGRELLELVDTIVEDYRSQADSEEARKRKQAVESVREHYQRQKPRRQTVFSCHELGKTYRSSGFRLHGVTMELRLGEITGVVGRNGNGKTTFFRLVAGELRNDEGTLEYPHIYQRTDLGTNIDWVSVKEQMAYVQQELPRWYGSLRDNLHYEAALHGLKGDDNEREVAHILERLGLTGHADKRWSQLSGGFKLRFALAKALVWKPTLLILDEPLANLDFKAQQIVLRDLRDLAKSFKYPLAVLISSQHLHEVEAISDSIVFLREGDVVYNGPLAGIGESRSYNVFELAAACDLATLRKLLNDPSYQRIHHSGVSFVIRADLDISGERLLNDVFAGGVEVEYFRDISRSTKQLFDETD